MICHAQKQDGALCRREAVAIDTARGQAVCAAHLPPGQLPEIQPRPLSGADIEAPRSSASAAAPAAWPEDW
jgi:hypothetical protein